MRSIAIPRVGRCLGLVAASIVLAATLFACGGDGSGAATSDRVLALEAKTHSVEESLEALVGENESLSDRVLALEAEAHSLEKSLEAAAEENETLRAELDTLRQEQAGYVQAQEAAEAAREREERQVEQLASLEGGQSPTDQRFDGLESRLQELEAVASKVNLVLPAIETWFKGMDDRVKVLEGTDLERTVKLAEAAGGEVYYIDSREPEERAILVMPLEPIDGNPLIVSLHGYGGNSADHSLYIPLHELVNSHGFGLLLPNGTLDGEGNPFWNPTDQCCDSGKTGADDVGYLAGLVARAKKVKDFGPVYFFGHSNGGFMSYWMACQGLPGLRAVASLAGTSYVDDSSCADAAPMSVLHIHGTSDEVVLFEGIDGETGAASKDGPGYAGAHDMMRRWGDRAGCDWPENSQPYATLDLDGYVPGAETQAYRLESGCAKGISIELWQGQGSGHGPGYRDAFTEALLDWLLAQK